MDNSCNFNVDTLNKAHYFVEYRGIKMIKCPFDYVLYQMLINEVNPDLIIEVGTAYGGLTLYLADLLELKGNGIVHTIDINDDYFNKNTEESKKLITEHKRIKRFLNGYQNYDLDNTKEFKNILIIDDGSHFYGDVLECLNKFKDVVSDNSYFIVEDGSITWFGLENVYNGGPLRAIDDFLKQNNNYSIDRKWCDFFGKNATFNPNGYLKKSRI